MQYLSTVLRRLILLAIAGYTYAYNRKPCNQKARSQFQLPDCYVPDIDQDLLLSEASFLFAHDAATGYIDPQRAIHSVYSKTQRGTPYDLLNFGARALDLRYKILRNNTVIFQHGSVDIYVSLERFTKEVIQWCNENEGELVLLLSNDLHYEASGDDDFAYGAVSAISSVYEQLGVAYYPCDAVYGMTVGQVMEMSALSEGGYLIALDRQDNYASFCGKSNWVEDELVSCYPSDSACTNNKGTEPMASLKQYVLASANNEATYDSQTLGPPADLETYPFNEIQAMWQITTQSAISGIAHLSNLIKDNTLSNVNREMARLVHSGEFDAISLFAVDNVLLDGLVLLSVLRTQCGQSSSLDVCGSELTLPRMMHVRMAPIVYWSIILIFGILIMRGIWRSHGIDMLLCVQSLYDDEVREDIIKA